MRTKLDVSHITNCIKCKIKLTEDNKGANLYTNKLCKRCYNLNRMEKYRLDNPRKRIRDFITKHENMILKGL
jgi:hypothetical protein